MKIVKKIILFSMLISSLNGLAISHKIVPVKSMAQSGTDCGYHAIKNANIIFDWTKGKINTNQRDKKLLTNGSHFPLQQWKKIVFKESGYDNNIDHFDIKIICEKELKLSSENFYIIPNIKQTNKILINPEIMKNISNKIKNNNNTSHIFIVGTATILPNNRSLGGHWLTVVAHNKNNIIYYYVLDSIGINNSTANIFGNLVHNLIMQY